MWTLISSPSRVWLTLFLPLFVTSYFLHFFHMQQSLSRRIYLLIGTFADFYSSTLEDRAQRLFTTKGMTWYCGISDLSPQLVYR